MHANGKIRSLETNMWVESGEEYEVVNQDSYGFYVIDLADGIYCFPGDEKDISWEWVLL